MCQFRARAGMPVGAHRMYWIGAGPSLGSGSGRRLSVNARQQREGRFTAQVGKNTGALRKGCPVFRLRERKRNHLHPGPPASGTTSRGPGTGPSACDRRQSRYFYIKR